MNQSPLTELLLESADALTPDFLPLLSATEQGAGASDAASQAAGEPAATAVTGSPGGPEAVLEAPEVDGGLGWWLLPIAILATLAAGRLASILWFLWGTRSGRTSGNACPLFPFQRETLRKLRNEIRNYSGRGLFISIALIGPWGAGKSAILRALASWRPEDEPKDKPELHVVYFDAWRHQSDSNLEWSLFKTIVMNRVPRQRLLARAWAGVPVFLLAWRATLGRLFVTLKFRGLNAQIADSGEPPEVRWRPALERFVAGLEKRGIQLVVALDELDRCDHHACQTYYTLIRRFLDVPGLVAIMPLAGEVLQNKAFNPLFSRLTDLADSSLALMMERHPDAIRDVVLDMDTEEQAKAWRQAPDQPNGAYILARLAASKGFEDLDATTRLDFIRAVSDKYEPIASVTVRPPSHEDINASLGLPAIREAIHQVTGLEGEDADHLSNSQLEMMMTALPGDHRRIVIRGFLRSVGALLDRNLAMRNAFDEEEPMPPHTFVLASMAASLQDPLATELV